MMVRIRRAEEPEASGPAAAWQAAHLVSGPLNLYRHYEVSVVDWLESRKVNEVSTRGRRQETSATAAALSHGRAGEGRSADTPGSCSYHPIKGHNSLS